MHASWNAATVAGITATGQPGARIYCPAADASGLIAKLQAAGAQTANAGEIRTVRIENGKPRYGEDISDRSLPQETQQMHAVSFTKGCYLGQEIVERIRAQGHVNKKLVRLEVSGADGLAAGAKATSNGADAGEITSSTHSPETGNVAALAYIRTPFAAPGTELLIGERTARVAG
jgi:folate-binding protein YgfZ